MRGQLHIVLNALEAHGEVVGVAEAGMAVLAWLVACLLLAWLGIEAMAAVERWFENDSRFQR